MVPEFDSPGMRLPAKWVISCLAAEQANLRSHRCTVAGHALSWQGYPVLTDCYDSQGRPTDKKGPMDPTRNETLSLMWRLFREGAMSEGHGI